MIPTTIKSKIALVIGSITLGAAILVFAVYCSYWAGLFVEYLLQIPSEVSNIPTILTGAAALIVTSVMGVVCGVIGAAVIECVPKFMPKSKGASDNVS